MFCKRTLDLKKNACSKLVYFELGRLPYHIFRKMRVFKYWLKLRKSNNCILKTCYEDMIYNDNTWVEDIRLELDKLGLAFLWFADYNEKFALKIIEQSKRCLYSGNVVRN